MKVNRIRNRRTKHQNILNKSTTWFHGTDSYSAKQILGAPMKRNRELRTHGYNDHHSTLAIAQPRGSKLAFGYGLHKAREHATYRAQHTMRGEPKGFRVTPVVLSVKLKKRHVPKYIMPQANWGKVMGWDGLKKPIPAKHIRRVKPTTKIKLWNAKVLDANDRNWPKQPVGPGTKFDTSIIRGKNTKGNRIFRRVINR
jgi:hypothetical protein